MVKPCFFQNEMYTPKLKTFKNTHFNITQRDLKGPARFDLKKHIEIIKTSNTHTEDLSIEQKL